MADKESTSEISTKVFDITQFDRIFKKHFRHQKLFLNGEERLEFPRFRALKKTFLELDEKDLSNKQLREIVQHLVKDKEYLEVFSEWIGIESKNWDAYLSSQNTHRIYAIGRNELIRKKGKTAISG